MVKSLNNVLKVAYNRRYESFPDVPGASRLVGYEVYGRVLKEGWSYYKLEAIAAEYWSIITKAIQKDDHTELPVDFPKSEQDKTKIKKDGIKVLEVILK
jgi:hypothetical protein